MITKKQVREYFGTYREAAKQLGYAHEKSVYRFPEILIDRQVKSVLMRMRAENIKIPKDWN